MARIVTDGTAYVNLSQVDTTAQFALGLKVQADSGQYLYAQANGAIGEGAACSFEVTSTDCQAIKQATGTTGQSIGAACEALADNEYGWFWLGGAGGYDNLLVVTGIADNAALTLDTAGVAGTWGAGGTAVVGAYAAAASGVGTGLVTCRSTQTFRS